MRHSAFATSRWARFGLGLLAAVVWSGTVRAASADENEAIFEARVIVNQDTYKLEGPSDAKDIDLDGSAPPPKVDLVLELKNVSKEVVTYFKGADRGGIDLELAGPGAFSIEPQIPQTEEIRPGDPLAIAPGKSIEIPITALHGGKRNMGRWWYWLKPGEYTLTVTVRAAYLPGAPPAPGAIFDTPKVATAVAKPVKLTVKP